MHEGLTPALFTIAGVTWLISTAIVARPLGVKWAAAAAALKIGLLVAYFGWFYDGTWTIKDDFEYHEQARILLSSQWNPVSLLFTASGVETLIETADRSRHILYTWWVYSAQYVFGRVYYAPVFMNVALTFVAAAMLYQLVAVEGFTQRYNKGVLLFFLFHWDVLAWSSLISIKDCLVMTMTLGAFFLMWPMIRKPQLDAANIAALLGIAVIAYAMTFLRFYIPVLMLVTLSIYYFLHMERARKYYFLLAASIVVTAIILFTPLIQFHIEKDVVADVKQFLTGFVRFPLTPRPWSLEPAYTFLFLPAALHWVFIVPAIVGACYLWDRSRLARLLIIYLVVIIGFYAVVEILQNTRQRFQVTYILAWLQFHFMVLVFDRFKIRGSPVCPA